MFNCIVQRTSDNERRMHYMMRRIMTYLSLREFVLMKDAITEFRNQYGNNFFDNLEIEVEQILNQVKEVLKKENKTILLFNGAMQCPTKICIDGTDIENIEKMALNSPIHMLL